MIHTRCWTRGLVLFLLVWFGILIYLLGPLWKFSENEELLSRQLVQANGELVRLGTENNELRDLLKKVQEKLVNDKINNRDSDNEVPNSHQIDKNDWPKHDNGNNELSQVVAKVINGPSKEYELTRRKLSRDVNELWWFIRAKLESGLKSNTKELTQLLNKTLVQTQHRYSGILTDLNELSEVDGFKLWREKEAKELSDLVQKRLHALQNPKDCSTAKKLICKLNKGCGYGCQIHHAMYCFIVAYGTERTLILKSKGWRYNKGGYEEVFKPLSDTCVMDSSVAHGSVLWPGKKESQVVEIPIVDSINPRPKYLPPAIPEDLADRLIRLHGNPIVWWVSEFLRYMLRPQSNTAELLKAAENGRDRSVPMVGIHVRRTDKVGTEAAFHSVDEYMKYVEEYFQQLETNLGRNVLKKRVYVASDDSKVLAECRKKFPDYEFLGDQAIAKSAAVSSRYNLNSLRGIISDIYMLSQSDYIVCTFSSQVCRIAYEIQQQRYVDGSWRYKSLDDIWYYGGQDEHQQEAIMSHHSTDREEIDLNIGDVIGVAGNHWNGFNKGRNHANNRIGLYPEYKTKEKIKIVSFPTYPHVKL